MAATDDWSFRAEAVTKVYDSTNRANDKITLRVEPGEVYGLLGIGLALVLGIGLRIAAVSGTLLLVGMWAAEWPLARFTSAGEPTMSTNPLVDYHIIYALALIALAVTFAGHIWGLGRRWAKLGFVQRNRWLI